MLRLPIFFTLTLLSVAFFATTASAVPISFACITGNSVTDCATGEAQLSVEVTALVSGQVQFDFMNVGAGASSIADVYFDDGSLLAIASLIDADDGVGGDPGVDFSLGATPPNLPGANGASPSFVATTAFSSDSDPPVQPNGVNPGEMLSIIFDLQGTQNFADVIDELTTGALRIGIHVQGFSGGGSESFVNNPVPEPGMALLMGLGLSILAGRRR